MKLYEYAYAKINLFLDVEGKAEDGFHSIRSVMHTVGLYDRIAVEIAPADVREIRIAVQGETYLPCDRRNLAYQAAEAFLDAYGREFSVRIEIEKHIPVAAGLAGGSSDAAAVLRALDRAMGYPFSAAELCRLGGALGSDVPYCIMGGTKLCTGRGELLTSLPFARQMYFVLVTGEDRVSTPQAYGALDRLYGDFSEPRKAAPSADALLSALRENRTEAVPSHLYNIFEEAVLPTHPRIAEWKAAMLREGALAALMSGSGPTVFGIFSSYPEARRAARAIGHGACAAESIPAYRMEGKV